MDKTDLSNPKLHFGPGRPATRAFLHQRLTGALNIPLTLFFVWLVLRLAGATPAEMGAVFANPFVLVLSILLFASVCWHMRIGIGEVIEDYVQSPGAHRLAMLANTLFALAVLLAGVASILKLAFWS